MVWIVPKSVGFASTLLWRTTQSNDFFELQQHIRAGVPATATAMDPAAQSMTSTAASDAPKSSSVSLFARIISSATSSSSSSDYRIILKGRSAAKGKGKGDGDGEGSSDARRESVAAADAGAVDANASVDATSGSTNDDGDGDDDDVVIAVAVRIDTILRHWGVVLDSLMPAAKRLKNDGADFNDIYTFLYRRVEAMALDDNGEQDAVDASVMQSFLARFDLRTNERLVSHFIDATLQFDDELLSGTLYVTNQRLLFAALNEGVQSHELALNSVARLEKASAVFGLGGSWIDLSTARGDFYTISVGSASMRDEAYNIIDQLWRMRMEMRLKTVEHTKETALSSRRKKAAAAAAAGGKSSKSVIVGTSGGAASQSSVNAIQARRGVQTSSTAATATATASVSTSTASIVSINGAVQSSTSSIVTNNNSINNVESSSETVSRDEIASPMSPEPTKKSLTAQNRNARVQAQFLLPRWQEVLYDAWASMWKDSMYVVGRLHVCTDYVCFASNAKVSGVHTSVVLPFRVIQRVEKASSSLGVLQNAIRIHTKERVPLPLAYTSKRKDNAKSMKPTVVRGEFFFIFYSRDEVYDVLTRQLTHISIWHDVDEQQKQQQKQQQQKQQKQQQQQQQQNARSEDEVEHVSQSRKVDSQNYNGDESEELKDEQEEEEEDGEEEEDDEEVDEVEAQETKTTSTTNQPPSSSSAFTLNEVWRRKGYALVTDTEDEELARRENSIRLRRWKSYFAENGCGLTIVRTDELATLLRGEGLPNELRGFFWQLFCGSLYKKVLRRGDYAALVTAADGHESLAAEEISRDLRRSLPSHPYYSTVTSDGEGIEPLRRVLTAYALHNPALGYCQSMNIVVALLLLYMDEESAFWVLCTLCEEMIPDYYSKVLIGSIVDQQILEYLVSQYLPKLYVHLTELGIQVGLFTLPWFMCLFITYLPWRETLLALDAFFFDGPLALFRISLAVLKLNESAILAQDNPEDIVGAVRNRKYSGNLLMDVAMTQFSDLTASKLDELRQRRKYREIMSMEQGNKRAQLRQVMAAGTKLTPDELDALYSEFHLSLPSSSSEFAVDFEQYQDLISKFCFDYWLNATDELQLVFERLSNDGAGKVSFDEFALLVSVVKRGTLSERVRFCLDYVHVDEDEEDGVPAACVGFGRLRRALCTAHKMSAAYEEGERAQTWLNEYFDMICVKLKNVRPAPQTYVTNGELGELLVLMEGLD